MTTYCGGLGNLGATCAVNALIQCITHTSLLRKFFLKNTFDESSISYQIKDVLHLIYEKHFSVAPKALLMRMYQLFPNNLHHGEQHDICELWMLISDKVAEEIGQPMQSPPKTLIEAPDDLENKIHHTIYNCNNKKYSPWIKMLQGIQLGILQCSNNECLEKYYNPEVFTTLTVDIQKSAELTPELRDLLLQFYKIEDLDVEGWKCDKCEQQSGAKKQIQLLKLPIVLIVVIKRFFMNENGQFQKINNPVHINPDLEISFNNLTFTYKLSTIGNHYGNYNGGHYTANSLFINEDDNTHTWVNYDDVNVQKIHTTDFLLNNRDAYILFYEQTNL
jgi:hypothetical protein